MAKKRKPNLFRILVLVAILLSVVAIAIGSISLVQNYKIKNSESFVVQAITKGDSVHYDGANLTLPISVTITNRGYNNLNIKTIKYQDQVFYTTLSSEDVDLSVYCCNTSTVIFNASIALNSDQVDYFNLNYGSDVDIPLAECYAYIVNGDKSLAEEKADEYQNKSIDLSFTTTKGTKYSN